MLSPVYATTADDIVFDSNVNGDDTVNTDIVDGSVIVAAGTAAVLHQMI